MTEKQKEAVKLLNNLRYSSGQSLNDDEYFLLMDFVLAEKEPQITYIPFAQPDTPLQPYYTGTDPYRVTCGGVMQKQ